MQLFNPSQQKTRSELVLKNVAKQDDLQACIALYDLARLSLKTKNENEWYKMQYEEALDYADDAIKIDVFLGHLIKIFVCVELIGRLNWIPSNTSETTLLKAFQDDIYPAFLFSLYIYDELSNSGKIDLEKYNLLPNFIHFEHDVPVEIVSEKFKTDLKEAISIYSQRGLDCNSLSRNEIKTIAAEAKEYVESLELTASLHHKPN